jgi:hypothetical protein
VAGEAGLIVGEAVRALAGLLWRTGGLSVGADVLRAFLRRFWIRCHSRLAFLGRRRASAQGATASSSSSTRATSRL